MKALKISLLVILVAVLIIIGYLFFFWVGIKKQPEWYKEPGPMPTHLADSILKRAKEKLVNAFNSARVDPKDPIAAVFSFAADNRTLESYLVLNCTDDLAASGFERPQLEKIGDNEVRVSTRVTTGTFAGSVIHTTVKISVTQEGKLRLEPGALMAGSRKVPDFALKRMQQESGFLWEPIEVAPQDIRFPDPDKRDLVINAKLLKVEVGDEEMVFTLRRTK